MLSWVEHEESCITLGPGHCCLTGQELEHFVVYGSVVGYLGPWMGLK